MTTPLDPAERELRELTSAVKRLRVAAMSDPSKGDDLADALVGLTGRRLLAWSFTDAATEAPESVLLSARILASRGAGGPYAVLPDAVRYFTATAQLAAVQALLGQTEGSGRTLDGLASWRGQLGRLPLLEQLPDPGVIWALLAGSRSVLSTDVARANAYADAAAVRLYAAGLDSAPRDAYLAVAVHLLLADCRWAAGHPEAALAWHRLAIDRHRSVVPGRAARPAVAGIAVAPISELYEVYAARLEANGDAFGGIAVRRAQAHLLQRFDTVERLAAARFGLAQALARAGRGTEADAELVEATALARRVGFALAESPPATPAGPLLAWEPLPAAAAWSATEMPTSAIARLAQDQQRAVFAGAAARAEAERDESRSRAAAEAEAAERSARQAEADRVAAQRAAAAAAAAVEAERAAADEAARRRAAEEAAARAAAEDRRRELAQARRERPAFDDSAVAAATRDLALAREAVESAGEDLPGLALGHEQLARVLRPLVAVAPDDYGPELLATVESLVGLRWRLGDADGSREAAREAKVLATEIGR